MAVRVRRPSSAKAGDGSEHPGQKTGASADIRRMRKHSGAKLVWADTRSSGQFETGIDIVEYVFFAAKITGRGLLAMRVGFSLCTFS